MDRYSSNGRTGSCHSSVSLLSTAVEVLVGRETDAVELRNHAAVATEDEWRLASGAVQLIQERGYARGRQLDTDLQALRSNV